MHIPFFKWLSVNLNDAVFDKSFSFDQLIICGIVNDINNFAFSSDTFRGPVEVTNVQS